MNNKVVVVIVIVLAVLLCLGFIYSLSGGNLFSLPGEDDKIDINKVINNGCNHKFEIEVEEEWGCEKITQYVCSSCFMRVGAVTNKHNFNADGICTICNGSRSDFGYEEET